MYSSIKTVKKFILQTAENTGGQGMLLEDAIALRIEQLCIERNMTKYALFEKSGMPQTTLTSIKKKRSRSVKIKRSMRSVRGSI